jgi:PIN domain nuclease of toxin-antitoxin system
VRLLLDTQVWLWMQAAPARIEASTRALIADTRNVVLLSAASSWEIAIKHAIGRLRLPVPPADYVSSRMARSGTAGLPVEHRHALQVGELPDHHRDPFDRLLIAQARIEDLALVTADRQLEAYDVRIIRA